MATYDNVYTPGFFGRVGQTVFGMLAAISAWNTGRMTRNSLHNLTDRELDDIGLMRADIDNVF
ncbi:DUF1127 domain-containing protein [Pseudopelagicola sp. nBUS_19]|uniref:DUF1127 domain-containing protein n=1 Tax=unclassified Pseudopelagicola TaxID=2649563 RepID=UPI003EB7A4E8